MHPHYLGSSSLGVRLPFAPGSWRWGWGRGWCCMEGMGWAGSPIPRALDRALVSHAACTRTQRAAVCMGGDPIMSPTAGAWLVWHGEMQPAPGGSQGGGEEGAVGLCPFETSASDGRCLAWLAAMVQSVGRELAGAGSALALLGCPAFPHPFPWEAARHREGAACSQHPKGCSDAGRGAQDSQSGAGKLGYPPPEVPTCHAVPCHAMPCWRWGCGQGREMPAERGWGHCCHGHGRDAEEGCDACVPMKDM